MFAFLAHDAFANGQTVHVYITLMARDALPEGELAAFLADEAVFSALVHGAMFPDGGYAVDDGYGELAHWEPFQSGWLRHVRDTCGSPPYSDVACDRRAAFLLGMASHGMADQFYDATYQDRARDVYDATSDWENTSMDEATDVVYASEHGGFTVPERWLPADELAPVFQSAVGHEVSADTLSAGQDLLEFAIGFVALSAQQPATVANYRAMYPWGTSHLDDETVPGRPAEVAVVVSRYWEVLWRRLAGDDALAPAVIYTNPGDGAYGHVAAGGDIESRVSIVMARGLSQAGFDTSGWSVVDEAQAPRTFTSDLYYRDASHVVNLDPIEGWSVDARHTVVVSAGTPAFDGAVLGGPFSFGFSTEPPPVPIDTATVPARTCGCGRGATVGFAPMLAGLLFRRRAR